MHAPEKGGKQLELVVAQVGRGQQKEWRRENLAVNKKKENTGAAVVFPPSLLADAESGIQRASNY